MSDVLSSEDLNALAAEYVLGTLDYEERKGASALLEVDPTFRGIVRIWEKRFGELHLMVEAVQPDPKLWERISPKFAGVQQESAAIPSIAAEPLVPTEPAVPSVAGEESVPATGEAKPTELPANATEAERKLAEEAEQKLAELAALLPAATTEASPPAPSAPPPAPSPEEARPTEEIPRGFVPPAPMVRRSTPPAGAPVVVRKSSRGWVAVSLAMGLVAVMLAGLISAWRFFPERLPEQLRAYTVLKIPLPPPPPPPQRPPAFDE